MFFSMNFGLNNFKLFSQDSPVPIFEQINANFSKIPQSIILLFFSLKPCKPHLPKAIKFNADTVFKTFSSLRCNLD